MSTQPRLSIRQLASEDGFTLMELLVAMATTTIVMAGLIALLVFSTKQESRISDRVQADRLGRLTMQRIVDELHSSCTGFEATAIQGPPSSETLKPPLEPTGPLSLWFISSYGSSTSENPIPSVVYEHDIHWAYTSTSKTGEKLGTLTDYTFQSKEGSGPNGASRKWEFPTLTVANAKAHVLSEDVAPISSSETIFQYYALSTPSGSFSLLSSGIQKEAEEDNVVKVAIAFRQAPTDRNTEVDRVVPFYNSVVLRFDPAETGEAAKDEPCE